MTSRKPYPQIDDVYRDKYKGENTRTVKVVERGEPDWEHRPRWVCVSLTIDDRPHLIGSRTVIYVKRAGE